MNDQKLSFAKTIENDWYALKLGGSISRSLVINSFFMRLAGYFEWVFFDAIFLREIVGALDENKSFSEIFVFIAVCGLLFGLIN
ncbi:MAG: ABC transporter ATP-binding protein, partial [Acetatifactor sp.]|nr:ABC transporter ATP-binding protein [Acetatifactor sp.]